MVVILLLFIEKIWPAIENIRSTAAEEACTLRYFLASLANKGNFCSLLDQNIKGEGFNSLQVLIYSSICVSKLSFFSISSISSTMKCLLILEELECLISSRLDNLISSLSLLSFLESSIWPSLQYSRYMKINSKKVMIT